MKKISSIVTVLLLTACDLTPKIIPDTTNSILNNVPPNIQANNDTGCDFGWILWYAPVALLALGWAFKELFMRKRK